MISKYDPSLALEDIKNDFELWCNYVLMVDAFRGIMSFPFTKSVLVDAEDHCIFTDKLNQTLIRKLLKSYLDLNTTISCIGKMYIPVYDGWEYDYVIDRKTRKKKK